MGKIFKAWDYNKPGKGVKKSSVKEDYSFGNFFKIYIRKFWKICSVNLLYFLFNFPFFAFLLGLSGNFNIPFKLPAGPMYQQIKSVVLHTGMTPATAALMGFERNGRLLESSYPSTVSAVLMWAGILIVLTFGLANCGMAYIFRNYAREDHAYVWSDYITTIKRNFLQAILLGIVDIAFGAVIVYDIIFFLQNTGISFVTDVMFWIALLLGLVYFIMRFYMYIILVTFKLSIFKIIKNSFIFTFLCIKRNIVGVLGVVAVLIINYLVLSYFAPLGAILPFLFTASLLGFIGAYTAYPGIKKYMIDPYYTKDETNDETPSIFTDN
ncbi:MAG: DUF624 domain-containing protein [Ruminococcaceae bacterium]|nr:DUF624 domain-containing protein [Oscillospiraceae bacterium]